jgi:YVTN family beta-propeller protein
MNFVQARLRLVQAGAVFATGALIAGCGNNYRAVVTPITGTGPAAETTSYVVAVSTPAANADGIATMIDYSGDSIMATAPIGPDPLNFTLDETGSTGYTVNSDGTLTNIPFSTTRLQSQYITNSTISKTSNLIGLFAPSSGLWATDLSTNSIDIFSSSPATLKMSLPVAAVPTMVIGPGTGGQRYYAISQVADSNGTDCNTNPSGVTSTGFATPIELAYETADTPIAVGKCPVFAVPSSDGKRLYVLNRGSDTITVINMVSGALDSCTPFYNQANALVTCHPTLPLSLNGVANNNSVAPPNGTSGMTQTAGPVFAEFNAATQQLIVSNYDGGTISIINVSLDEYGNDANTYDSKGNITGGFGTTYTVAVGNKPAAVSVLYDGSYAYAANQADGTVSVVNLSSHSLEKTLTVVGNPRSIVSTQNSETAKVYVSSPNSDYITVIDAETKQVLTTILTSGNLVDIRTTSQNGNSGNDNDNSRRPGFGQPCFMPDTTATKYSASLATCEQIPYSGT